MGVDVGVKAARRTARPRLPIPREGRNQDRRKAAGPVFRRGD